MSEAGTHDVALLLEQHVIRTIHTADVVLLAVLDLFAAETIDTFGASVENREKLVAVSSRLDHVGTVSVFDVRGDLVTTSRVGPVPRINIADREHFVLHRDGVVFHVGRALAGRVTGQRIFTISRRISNPDGSFGGVVVAAIYAPYFERAYQGVRFGDATMLAIVRHDGALVMSSQVSDDKVETSLAGSDLFARLSGAPSGTFEGVCPLDGQRRIISFRRVEGLPLIVIAGVTRAGALRAWWNSVIYSATLVGSIFCVLGILAWMVVRRIRDEEQAKDTLEQRVEERTADLEVSNRQVHNHARTLDVILAASPDITFLVDNAMQFAFANPAAAVVLGVSGGAQGFSSIEIAPLETEIRAVLADGQSRTMDTGFACSFEWKLTAMPGDDGAPAAVLCVGRDVTRRRQIEETLRRARLEAERATQSKTQFLAAASHDLRQPLQAQRVFQSLLEKHLTTPKQKDIAARMARSLEASETLLATLMDVSALEAGAVRPAVTTVMVSDILSRIAADGAAEAEAKGLKLTTRITDWPVNTDPVLLERIVRNLMVNALRYTERGGVLLATRRRASNVLIQVWDTGTGIPPDRISMIFEDFYQVGNPERDRTKGLGLGLAVVARMTRLLGHGIDVASRPGRGTVFSVKLPLASVVPCAEDPITVSTGGGLTGATILLVEDDRAQREAMSMLFEDAGARIIALPTGVSVEEQLAGAGVVPDIILSDYRLPGAVSGLDVVERVRAAIGRHAPAIIQTGDVDPALAEVIRSRDCAIMHKPCDPDHLRSTVAALVRL
ncbi:MAG: ATP-binding protein [Alphaproteobacteria bacterium]